MLQKVKEEDTKSNSSDSKTYSLVITGTQIQSITTENAAITITGTADFRMQGDLTSCSNWVIPDLKQPVSGCFVIDDNTKLIELKGELPIDEVKKLVFDYLEQHNGARTSDIIFDLCLDPEIVLKALNELGTENKVECKDARPKSEQK
jgi:hypothetical protein